MKFRPAYADAIAMKIMVEGAGFEPAYAFAGGVTVRCH